MHKTAARQMKDSDERDPERGRTPAERKDTPAEPSRQEPVKDRGAR